MQAKNNVFFGITNFKNVYNAFSSSDLFVKYVFY
jgi:hypothetical protein